MEKSWDLMVEAEKPINTSELQVTVKPGQGLDYPIHRSYEAGLIEIHWQEFVKEEIRRKEKELKEAAANDPATFERLIQSIARISQMYRLNSADLNGQRITLNLGLTDFKEYVGTTRRALLDPDFRRELMQAGVTDQQDPNHYFANPLTISTNIVTSDRITPIFTRSKTVAIYRGAPHFVSGAVDVKDGTTQSSSGEGDMFLQSLDDELIEEAGILKEDIERIDFLAIVRNNHTRAPEMLYNTELKITAKELEERLKSARDRHEHGRVSFYGRRDLPAFLKKNRDNMVPSGEALLDLFLRKYS